MPRNVTTVSIPKPLADKLRERINGTAFNNLSSYVTFVLREVLAKVNQRIEKEGNKSKEAFTKEDEEEVKARLRSLGYLD